MRILVVGAGLAGLTLALCLGRSGHEVIVVERSRELRGAGYMIDFFGSGYDVGLRLDLLRDLEAIHYPIEQLAFFNANGAPRFRIEYATMRRILGGKHFNFMRGELERLLFEALPERARIRFATSLESFHQTDGKVVVQLSEGSLEEVDLLVGADGVHSRVRTLAFGPEDAFVRELGYHTAAFVFEDAAVRREIGNAFATVTDFGRQMALYPIREGRVAAFWVHKSEMCLADRSAQAAARELREVYGGLRWLVPRVLDHADHAKDIYFDTVSQVVMPGWSKGRVVLLGDACQCVSLLAGQGASMAVGAAYVLAQELARGTSSTTEALARYEQRLRPAIGRKQRAGRQIARWFVPEGRVRLAVRDAVLRMSASKLGAWILQRQVSAESVVSEDRRANDP